jgi:Protein of unknown function (DUF3352)
MKRRSFFSILVGAALVLLLVAGGGLYWILTQSPLQLLSGGVQKNPSAAIFVPKQSPVVVSLLVSPEELEAFARSVAPIGQRRQSSKEFAQIERGLLANTGADYVKDIQPWLGDEVTFALTAPDFDRNAENGAQPGYLLVAGSKDGDLAREFLQLFYARGAIAGTSELVFEEYQGVNLIYRRNLTDNSTTSASAVVGDRFVLFANHPRVLREAINNVQAIELNLNHDPAYQNALTTIQSPRIGVAVVNLPGLAAWIAKQPIPPELEQTLTVTLALSRQGLVAQTALAGLNGDESIAPVLSEPVKALEYIPAHPILTAAGSDLNQLWQQVSAGVTPDSASEQILQQALSRLNETLGVDLVEEIFSWARGEYAVAWLPATDSEPADWLFVAEKTPEAEAAIARLDTLARAEDLSVGNFTLDGSKIAVWTELKATLGQPATRLEAVVKGVHTSTDNYEIFSSSLDGLAQALSDRDNSLIASNEFKDAIALLPKANDGYFYLDWGQSQSVLEQNIPLFRVVEFAGRPLFRNLRSLILSSGGRENGISRASILLKLGSAAPE